MHLREAQYAFILLPVHSNTLSSCRHMLLKPSSEQSLWELGAHACPSRGSLKVERLPDQCVQEPLWLVWQYEGDYTLYDLMQKKEWPYNLEPFLFGRELNLPKSPERRWLSLRTVMKQVLTSASYGVPLWSVHGNTAFLFCVCTFGGTHMVCWCFKQKWPLQQHKII